MATPEASISHCDAQELQERRYAVESTIGTTLAEGEPPSAEALEFFEKYASGEVSLAEVSRAVRALHGI